MNKSFIFIFFIFFIFSIITPIFVRPISSFFSEYIFFISFIFFVLSISFNYKKIFVPKFTLIILFLIIVCILQSNFFEISLLFYIIYLFTFFIAIVLGFNQYNSSRSMAYLSVTFLITGLLSTVLAYIQWLGFSQNQNYILTLVGNRPYANFAQPNHLATFLFLSLISLYYLFEKNKIKPLFSLALLPLLF